MDVSCPFWAVEGSGYALEGRFKTGVAAIRRSMKLIHDALTKVLCCWHKNFGGGKRVTHDLWKKDLVALGFLCMPGSPPGLLRCQKIFGVLESTEALGTKLPAW